MGTHALTVVRDERDRDICVLYRQYDGYPDGHGQELKEFLAPIKLVNGIGGDTTNIANGMDCLAAQIVAHFKREPGGFYLQIPGPPYDEFYVYYVYPKGKKIYIRATEGDTVTYDGIPSKWKIKK